MFDIIQSGHPISAANSINLCMYSSSRHDTVISMMSPVFLTIETHELGVVATYIYNFGIFDNGLFLE